jgi:anaphase-promoting complex subunit 6
MFIGMEHIVLSNYGQADEALDAADAMCDGDPLLINERGVMAFNHGRCPTEFVTGRIQVLTGKIEHRFTDAVVMFESALQIAQVTQTSQASWATTWLNLGTSLRKLGKLSEAREAYIKVLEIDSRSAPALGFLGLVYHLMDKLDDAIVKYHEVCFVPFLLHSVAPLHPYGEIPIHAFPFFCSKYLYTTFTPFGRLTRFEVGHADIRGTNFRLCRSTRLTHMSSSCSTSLSKQALTLAHSCGSVWRAEVRSGRGRCARMRRARHKSRRYGQPERRKRRQGHH